MLRILPALLAVLLVLSGCSGDREVQSSQRGEDGRSSASEQRAEVRQLADSIEDESGELIDDLENLSFAEIRDSLRDIQRDARRLGDSLDGLAPAAAAPAGREAVVQDEEESSLVATALLVLVIILALYIVVRLIRSRNDFEEEDDFEDWEDDEDLGFDEEFEDDFEDDDAEEFTGDDDSDEKKDDQP